MTLKQNRKRVFSIILHVKALFLNDISSDQTTDASLSLKKINFCTAEDSGNLELS